MPQSLRPLLSMYLTVLLCVIAGCSSNKGREHMGSPDKLYEMADKAMQNGDFREAVEVLETLEARFPFSNPARQGQLDLMYAYYKARQPESAVDQADQFIRENPTHPRVDYAHYIKGLVWFERNRNFLERWFKADLTERPPIDARKSFQSFQTLLQRYPNSEYAADARQRMIFLRNRLAEYEVHVARYYLKRGAYVGAINRAKYAIENYDGSPAVREALRIMVVSYEALDLKELAASTQKVLTDNYGAMATDQPEEKKHWWELW